MVIRVIRIRTFVYGLGLCFSCIDANAAQIWLAGVDPVVRATSGMQTDADYEELFQPGAAWSNAARSVQVFKTSTRFLANASDDTLIRMFADLKRRNIALGAEALMLTAVGKCGAGIEGYSSPNAVEMVASRVRRLGGDLRYVAMDEPFDFGHYSSLPNACHSSVADLAADVTGKVRAIRRVFPEVQIGDIEVIGHSGREGDIDALMQWTKAYQDAAGEPLAFLHFDVVWSGPWRQQLAMLAPRLHAAGIKVGVIYNGDPDDPSDLAWTSHAEQRFSTIEADPAITPDQAIIQTWMPHPSHILPETQPGTLTWLVNRYYLTAETRLVLHRTGNRLQGELTDAAGHPLPAAQVTLSAQLVGEPGAPVLHTRSGQVPQKAAAAVLALRINAECNCSGPADIVLGPVRYRDDRTGQIVERAFPPTSARANTSTSVRFQAEPAQPISQNAPKFPVIPDNPYTIEVPMSTTLASAGSGYVALVFLDAQGKEIERLRLPFDPVERPIGTLTTDAQGRFTLSPDNATLRASVSFRAAFNGDARHRLASATVR